MTQEIPTEFIASDASVTVDSGHVQTIEDALVQETVSIDFMREIEEMEKRALAAAPSCASAVINKETIVVHKAECERKSIPLQEMCPAEQLSLEELKAIEEMELLALQAVQRRAQETNCEGSDVLRPTLQSYEIQSHSQDQTTDRGITCQRFIAVDVSEHMDIRQKEIRCFRADDSSTVKIHSRDGRSSIESIWLSGEW